MADKTKWACPKCGADANEHGDKKKSICGDSRGGCMGFICECESDTDSDHGDSPATACPNANCYHCGWGGTFPPAPLNLKGWAKTAWAAGWRPPAGWQP